MCVVFPSITAGHVESEVLLGPARSLHHECKVSKVVCTGDKISIVSDENKLFYGLREDYTDFVLLGKPLKVAGL